MTIKAEPDEVIGRKGVSVLATTFATKPDVDRNQERARRGVLLMMGTGARSLHRPNHPGYTRRGGMSFLKHKCLLSLLLTVKVRGADLCGGCECCGNQVGGLPQERGVLSTSRDD